MIGQRSLIEARLGGYRPADVLVICLQTEQQYGQFTDPEKQISRTASGQWSGYPEIHVHDNENAASLDLRAVVGTVVHIASPTRERGLQILRRVSEFSPKKAIAAGSWGMVGWKPDAGFREWKK